MLVIKVIHILSKFFFFWVEDIPCKHTRCAHTRCACMETLLFLFLVKVNNLYSIYYNLKKKFIF